MTKNSRNALAFVLVTSLFFMWGLANNMTDTLLAAFKRVLSLSDFQTSFVQSAFYGAYFCLALPAAFLIKKYSYKIGILIGLGLFIAGALLFYPASQSMVYSHFLLALFILAGGLSILETAANPYILEIGSPETATKRLNLAQSFNPIGSISGVILSKYFILSKLDIASMEERSNMDIGMLQEMQGRELQAVMGPYVGVALVLVVLWLIIFFSSMPQAKDNDQLHLKASFSRLIQNKSYLMSVVAQFFYVGAQIGVWSFTIRYVMEELSIMEADASTYYIAALVVFLISRFICTYLMNYIQPARLLQFLSVAAMLLLGLAIVGSGYFGVIALIAVSACMSLMFPTIFGLGLKGLGEDTKIGGAGLIMAILGGAVLPVLQGQLSDYTGSIKLAFIIPILCFSVVYYFGRISKAK
ncbi:L-fucose:H+ symporter permease [Belliella sp. DSM 111904]|uniref:L-fucose:H+ symporter permease n=1 Tax=Belliella filtrata TaxID=2923435 RepID=A0ABS9V2X1_9BACT|nr:L-fucose:H+ symporter permease [Belliella filtrata]MCH7410767.1 L-fucose:H+ symporter permease [Belliella filtrata]